MASTDVTVQEILELLNQTGKPVIVRGFGTFKIAERAARKGRNPRTGEELDIAGYRTIVFSASPAMKQKT